MHNLPQWNDQLKVLALWISCQKCFIVSIRLMLNNREETCGVGSHKFILKVILKGI
jgi:hypothetical protein